jgi:uncharacterized membrane protein
MDAYLILKYLHVIFVIIWLGGGFAMVVLGARASRTNDTEELVHIVRDVIYLATHVFVPASLLVVVLGLTMVWLNWSFSQIWVDIGLLGFALTFFTGLFVLKPKSEQVGALFEKEGITDEVVDRSRQILRIAEFDFVMLYIVVADMVLKPTIENTTTLVIMALVLIAGAIYFLGRARMPVGTKARA